MRPARRVWPLTAASVKCWPNFDHFRIVGGRGHLGARVVLLEQAHVQGNVEREAADLDTLNHRSLGRSDRRFSAAFRTPAHQGATDSPGSEERFLTDRKLADFSRNVGGGVQLFRQALVITDLSRLFLVVVRPSAKVIADPKRMTSPNERPWICACERPPDTPSELAPGMSTTTVVGR